MPSTPGPPARPPVEVRLSADDPRPDAEIGVRGTAGPMAVLPAPRLQVHDQRRVAARDAEFLTRPEVLEALLHQQVRAALETEVTEVDHARRGRHGRYSPVVTRPSAS
ncbi:hypothetical protein [Saccharothrix sp. NRRL B-16348]|uniref:hypothetical protein n=1 Tax=Saccharothrix sp. NRRL B-16348 TaxID=1415542 RepID=UPI001E4C7283|nr:hypothetical protein [Saccharothrix sp. NRRL B-16348]